MQGLSGCAGPCYCSLMLEGWGILTSLVFWPPEHLFTAEPGPLSTKSGQKRVGAPGSNKDKLCDTHPGDISWLAFTGMKY